MDRRWNAHELMYQRVNSVMYVKVLSEPKLVPRVSALHVQGAKRRDPGNEVEMNLLNSF